MTWLLEHWWSLVVIGGVGDVVTAFGLSLLRYQRLMICRTHWRIRACWEPISLIVQVLLWWAIGPLWLTNIMWGLIALGEIFDLVIRDDKWAVKFTWPAFSPPFVVVADGPVRTIREARRHCHHDEDCEFGPRRHPFAGKVAHLFKWRKITLNPAFQPA